jgi:chromosomal replication initiator protein
VDNLPTRVLQAIQEQTSVQTYDTWFRPLKIRVPEPQRLRIEVPNRFFREWIVEHHLTLIREAIRRAAGEGFTFEIGVSPAVSPALFAPPAPEKPPAFGGVPRGSGSLNPKYTFDGFVVGASNQFAHAAALAVSNHPGNNYNPLFIYGGVGLGKTHLLNAIGHSILCSSKEPSVCYVTSERFNTFNALHDARRQIVVTSDKFPKDIPHLEARLRSRFEWGLIADIQPPEMETKVAILKKKAQLDSIVLPDDVAFFLASNVKSNIRELEGFLIRIAAFASMTSSYLTVDLARQVLRDLIKIKGKDVTVESIQRLVASHFQVSAADLKSKKKQRTVVLPRQIAMYLARKMTNFSFPEIGTSFGGKDHSTVIHAFKKIERALAHDPHLKQTVDRLVTTLEL